MIEQKIEEVFAQLDEKNRQERNKINRSVYSENVLVSSKQKD